MTILLIFIFLFFKLLQLFSYFLVTLMQFSFQMHPESFISICHTLQSTTYFTYFHIPVRFALHHLISQKWVVNIISRWLKFWAFEKIIAKFTFSKKFIFQLLLLDSDFINLQHDSFWLFYVSFFSLLLCISYKEIYFLLELLDSLKKLLFLGLW
jgi:hypothetical protein